MKPFISILNFHLLLPFSWCRLQVAAVALEIVSLLPSFLFWPFQVNTASYDLQNIEPKLYCPGSFSFQSKLLSLTSKVFHDLPTNCLCLSAQSLQSCPTVCNPMDDSTPSSSVHGILQARILEWMACPPAGDLPEPGIKPASPVFPELQVDISFTTEPQRKPQTAFNPRQTHHTCHSCSTPTPDGLANDPPPHPLVSVLLQ